MLFDHCAAWTFGHLPKGKARYQNGSCSPGPGSYYPTKYTFPNPKGFKMGSKPRGEENKNDYYNPGVGNYSIPSSFPEGPKYSMKGPTGGYDPSKTNCSPGPGAYHPIYKSGAPAYSLGGRSDITPDNAHNPGVGGYNIRTDKSLVAPSYVFGSEPKGSNANLGANSGLPKWNEDPGPGNYSPNPDNLKRSAPNFSFGKQPRMDEAKPRAPAPGTYNFKPKFGNEGPAQTMGGITSNPNKNGRLKDQTPGPGAYSTTMYNKPNIPGFKMGSSPRDMPNNLAKLGNPGPGEYSYDKSYNNTVPGGPKWGMGSGTETRMDPRLKDRERSPGPGMYNIGENMGRGPKYSLGAKYKPDTRWKDSIPAPGTYNNGTMKNLKSGPGWKMGTELRGDEGKGNFKNNFPAPGQYDTRGNFIAPSTRFAKSPRMDAGKGDITGPGAYRIPCSIVDVNPYTRAAGKFDPKFKYV